MYSYERPWGKGENADCSTSRIPQGSIFFQYASVFDTKKTALQHIPDLLYKVN